MAGIEVGRCHGVDVVGVPSSSSFSITRRSKVEEGKEGEEEEEEEGEEEIDHQFDKILHLTGPDTLADSMSRAKRGGTVCLVSGSPADAGRVGSVDLMDLIPSEVKLTVYKPDMEQFMTTPFEALVREIERGRIKVPAARVLRVEDMSETQMEEVENKEDASGKVVVLF